MYLGKILPRGDVDVTGLTDLSSELRKVGPKIMSSIKMILITCSLGEIVYHGNIITLTMGFICRIQASRNY